MSNPTRSLNADVPHRQLLDLLGCTVRTHGLPQRTRCPLCEEGILQVVEDHSCGGEWFSCQGCGQSGDMIELASRVWRLDISSTIARLARRGFELPADPKSVAQYQREHLDYRQRLQGLWQQASDGRLRQSGQLMGVLSRLGIHSQLSADRWNNGPGAMLGGIDAASVESCFFPLVMQHAKAKGDRCNPSQRAIFRGGGWNDVLALPFQDLPGRVCSFLFIGRQGDSAGDFVFKRANWGPKVNQHQRPVADAGLAWHPRALELSEDWEHTVFAIADPVLALRLQFRHFEHHLHPLPVAVWFDSDRYPDWLANGRPVRTQQSWQMLGQRRIVFWMPWFDFSTLRQAIDVDGLISTVGPRSANPVSLQEYCWKQMPDEILHHVQRHARSWPEVLSQHLQQLSPAKVEELLCRFEQAGADVAQIIRRCDPGTRLRVTRIQSAAEMPRRVVLDGRTVIETNATWQLVNKNRRLELIVDAALRLDAIVTLRRTKERYYAGRVAYQGHEIEFCDRQELIDRDPFAWMQDLLLKREVGYLLFNPRWSRNALHIAQLFQQPRLIEGASTVGFDAEGNRFVFPAFAIHVGGAVKPLEVPIFPDDAPAQRLEQPIVLSGEEVDRPAEQEAFAPLFWAITAGVAANILAPAFNELPTGIALEGTAAIRVGEEIVESLGCVVVPINCAKHVQQVLNTEHVHHWPNMYRVIPGVQPRHWRKLLSDDGHDFRDCLVGVDWDTAQALRMRPGWNVIAGDRCAHLSPEIQGLARQLIPAYIRSVCERGLCLVDWENSEESFVERVLRDLAGFVATCHGNPDAVLEAHSVLSPDREEGDAAALADFIGQLVRERRLKVALEEDGRGKATLIEMPERDALSLSHRTLAKLLNRVEAPTIQEVAWALRHEDALIEEREDGWIFDANWFWKRQRVVEQLNSGMLKVHV